MVNVVGVEGSWDLVHLWHILGLGKYIMVFIIHSWYAMHTWHRCV